jgi:acyl carrier protein
MAEDANFDAYAESLIEEYITKGLTNPQLLPIRRDTELIGSGILDSLSILKLAQFLEEKFGVTVIPDDVVNENFETVGAICRFLKEKKGIC